MCSFEPAAIRLRLAAMLAYRPGLVLVIICIPNVYVQPCRDHRSMIGF
jgi:hypothetical protein